jgi:hypothetical protein
VHITTKNIPCNPAPKFINNANGGHIINTNKLNKLGGKQTFGTLSGSSSLFDFDPESIESIIPPINNLIP